MRPLDVLKRRYLEFRARRKIAAYERRYKKPRPWNERPAPIDVEATFDEFVVDFGGCKISELMADKSEMPLNADYLFREQNVIAELKTLTGIFAGPNAPKQLADAYIDAGSTGGEFLGLDPKLKKELLAGQRMMITHQKDLIAALGIDQREFDFFWNYLSQYTHVLSFTFYRIEPNGRGSGLENEFDRDALCMVLEFCTVLMIAAVDRLVELFPDAAAVRQGLDSKFSPGPAKNLPKHVKRERKMQRWR